jgi:aflatoxin B1 aldehyde reductase
LSRRAEVELFTALKAFDMRFYAYNPLAGGMLTGKHRSFNEVPTDGRFALRKTYPARYWKESFFKAVEIIRRACTDISMVEATFRWLAFHSSLDPERRAAIIIGASGLKQLEQNLNSFANGPLPDAIVAAFEEAWEVSSADAPEYFTLYKG